MVTKRLVRIKEGKVVEAVAVDEEENFVVNQLPKNNSNGGADKKAAPPTKKSGDTLQRGSIGKSENCHGRSKQDASAYIMPPAADEGKSAASAVPTVGQRKSSRQKKRSIPFSPMVDGKKKQKKRRKIDLSDVPAQQPILKSGGRKGGTSKYQGVRFHKQSNKWEVSIMIDGKAHHIGYYDNEKKAAVDYARAVFKYVPKKLGQKKKKQVHIDLTDVPEQPLILGGSGKSGTSKYQGVHFAKAAKKWRADIRIDGEKHYIGIYDSEEEAALDYARAAYKYRAGSDVSAGGVVDGAGGIAASSQ